MFFPNAKFGIANTQIHCETSIYYSEWKMGIHVLIYQNSKEKFSYNVSWYGQAYYLL